MNKKIVRVYILVVENLYKGLVETYTFQNKGNALLLSEEYNQSSHFNSWIETHEIKVNTDREKAYEYTGNTIVRGW